jgi:ubiquinone biosynthesis protein UbiJ
MNAVATFHAVQIINMNYARRAKIKYLQKQIDAAENLIIEDSTIAIPMRSLVKLYNEIDYLKSKIDSAEKELMDAGMI